MIFFFRARTTHLHQYHSRAALGILLALAAEQRYAQLSWKFWRPFCFGTRGLRRHAGRTYRDRIVRTRQDRRAWLRRGRHGQTTPIPTAQKTWPARRQRRTGRFLILQYRSCHRQGWQRPFSTRDPMLQVRRTRVVANALFALAVGMVFLHHRRARLMPQMSFLDRRLGLYDIERR